MSLGTVSITSSLLRGIAEGVDEVAHPSYITIITIIFSIIITGFKTIDFAAYNIFCGRQYVLCHKKYISTNIWV